MWSIRKDNLLDMFIIHNMVLMASFFSSGEKRSQYCDQDFHTLVRVQCSLSL